MKFENFSVRDPLVLEKPLYEHFKFLARDILAYFGINRHEWHDNRRYYYTPGQMGSGLRDSRLGQDSIKEVSDFADILLARYKKQINKFTEEELPKTTQGQALPLIREIFEHDSVHKRVIDIGSSYSRVFRSISLDYPEYRWDFVDFPSTLEAINSEFATPSMNFHSAYPLEYLETTNQHYDVAIFNRTLAVIGVEQVGKYLDILRNRARYVVFAEPCKTLFEPGSLNIDAISVDRPRCYSGAFLVHNYRALFKKFGFKLIHYDADSTRQINSTPYHFIIRGVAVPMEINQSTGAAD